MSSWETLETDALNDTKLPDSRATSKCKFALFLEGLASDARSHVESALVNEKISGRALYRALKARGMDCKHTVFREHRVSKCICFIKRD